MSEQVTVIDLDDTLVQTGPACIEYVSAALGIEMTPGDILSSAYWRGYGISDERATAVIHDYNMAGYPGARPMPGAYEALSQFRAANPDRRLFVATARVFELRDSTKANVEESFPDIFEDVLVIGNPWVDKEKALPKPMICQRLGAKTIVDDYAKTIVACAEIGMKGVLFGGHEWHGEFEGRPNIHLAAHWDRAVAHL